MTEDNYIRVDDKLARICVMFDTLDEETKDPSKAVKVLYQYDHERRPDGVKQMYHCIHIPPGSLEEVQTN